MAVIFTPFFLFSKKDVSLSENQLKMEYTAIIEQTNEGGYIAHCAEVPNAHTQGETIEEVTENLKEAIELILSCEREISMRKNGQDDVLYFKIALA
jgi:predicted RNase H-like HicB family nuclease